MTNNPTIDGVSRKTIERIADHCKFWKDHAYIEAIGDIEPELRALLDAPASDLREHCKQCAEVVKTWPEWKQGCLGGAGRGSQPGDEVSELGALRRLTEDSCNELVSRCLEHADEIAALQSTIAQLQARVAELELDKGRLDALDSNCWDVRFGSTPNGDAGDSSINIEIVGHWMGAPFERVIGENYSENLRAAIDQAMTAPAYPPERPEYPELEDCLDATAALNEKSTNEVTK